MKNVRIVCIYMLMLLLSLTVWGTESVKADLLEQFGIEESGVTEIKYINIDGGVENVGLMGVDTKNAILVREELEDGSNLAHILMGLENVGETMEPVDLTIPDVVLYDQTKTVPSSLLSGAPIIITVTAYYTESPVSNVCINPTGVGFKYVRTETAAGATSITVDFMATGMIEDQNGDFVDDNDPVGGYNDGGFATYNTSVSASTPIDGHLYRSYKAFPANYYIWVRGVGYGRFRVFGSASTPSGPKPFDVSVQLDM